MRHNRLWAMTGEVSAEQEITILGHHLRAIKLSQETWAEYFAHTPQFPGAAMMSVVEDNR